jgi:hypothetical protein
LTTKAPVVPVRGLVYTHAKRTSHDFVKGDVPATFVVSHVDKKSGLVYSKPHPYGGDRIKAKLASFSNFVLDVVSVPDVNAPTYVKLTPAECEALYSKAHKAGLWAGNAVKPFAMVVEQHENAFDDSSPVTHREVVRDGLCGFAWIKVVPATGSFARWCRKNVRSHKGFGGGEHIWVRDFDQSFERKEAYACEFVNVLREAGLTAYAGSRLD